MSKHHTTAIENLEEIDDMSASIPRSIQGGFNNMTHPNGEVASVMSSSTFGFTNDNNNKNKKDDESTLAGTMTSKGVESLIFGGLTNIDENQPLRGAGATGGGNGVNHFARAAISHKRSNMDGATTSSSVADELSVGAGSVRSVFTEKRQEDIDRLFEDLLGGRSSSTSVHHGAGDGDALSTASTAMSSIMPIATNPNTGVRARASASTDLISVGGNTSYAATSSHYKGGGGGSNASNQYIFGNGKSIFSNESSAADHELIYGESSKGKKVNTSVLERFARFYRMRSSRMVEMRTGSILLALVCFSFVSMQFAIVGDHNQQQMEKLKQADNYNYNALMADKDNRIWDGRIERPVPIQYPRAITTPANENRGSVGLRAPNRPPNFNGPEDPVPNAPGALADNVSPKLPPDSFHNLVDLQVGGPIPHNKEVPFFWQVPRAGGGTLRDILSECMGAVLAAEPGGRGPFAGDQTLEVFLDGKGSFINVDTTFLGGIERAKQLDLLGSGKFDVLVSPYVFETSTIFRPDHMGRMFAFIRHPIERCASVYAYKKTIDPEIARMSLLDYARSSRIENNWMTRYLSNQLTGEVTNEHVIIAKEILKTKCLIGLKENLWASIKRFEMFFGWDYKRDPAVQYDCRKQKLEENTDTNKYPQAAVVEGTQEWTMLLWQNKFDMKLYKFAQDLFKEQASLFPPGQAPL